MAKPRSHSKILWIGIPALLAAAWWLWPHLGLGTTPDRAPSFDRASLTIQRAGGQSFPLNIELAVTPYQHSYGLMFRRSLPEDEGMLFIFQPEQVVGMWMKNTVIPLDMLFIRADGTIAKIAEHAQPYSLTTIMCEEPVRGVLEINGGAAAQRGLKTGDKVLYPAFSSQ